MVEFRPQPPQSVIDPSTGNVVAWDVRLEAVDTDDPTIAAGVDARVEVPETEQKPEADWTPVEVRNLAFSFFVLEEYTVDPDTGEKTYSKRNWFNQLIENIEGQKGAPMSGSRIVI